MKIAKIDLGLIIENFLFEDDSEEQREKEKQDFLDAASHKERYGKNLSKQQLAYLKRSDREANRTLFLDPEKNTEEEERFLRKFKPADVLTGKDNEGDNLLNQTITDMIYQNMKRIKDLEDKYQIIAGNFKVIDGNTKDNKKHIINLNKDIVGLASLYNPETKEV